MAVTDPREFHPVIVGMLRDMQPSDVGLHLPLGQFSKWAQTIVTHVDYQEISIEMMIVVKRLLKNDAWTAASQLTILVALTLGSQVAERLAVDAGVDPVQAKKLIHDGSPTPTSPSAGLEPPKGGGVKSKGARAKSKKR